MTGPVDTTVAGAARELITRVASVMQNQNPQWREHMHRALRQDIDGTVGINTPDANSTMLHTLVVLAAQAITEWAKMLDVPFDSLLNSIMSIEELNIGGE